MMSNKYKFQTVERLPEFEKEFKKLKRRYKTLDDDLDTLIDTQLAVFHKLNIDNRGTFRIDDLGDLACSVFKTKKFACRSLKGKGAKTGLRLIHAYFETEDRIDLVEIYYKGDKENENRKRILEHYRRT